MGISFVTGIDFGHYSIKIVVLKAIGQRIELAHYQEILTIDAIFSDNHTFDHHPCVKILKEFKKQSPITAPHAVISVPNNAVISKNIQIDANLATAEKEFAIFQAFASQSPFSIEALSVDYIALSNLEKTISPTKPEIQVETIKQSDTANSKETESYQVYATRKEVIENRLNLLKSSGFKPLVIDTFIHGLLRIWQLAFLHNPSHKNWLLIDIGFSQTSLCIIPNYLDIQSKTPQAGIFYEALFRETPPRTVSYFKQWPFGTKILQSHMSSLVTPHSLSQHSDTIKKFNEMILEFAQSLRRQISLYESVNPTQSIQGLWLTGGGADLFQQAKRSNQEGILHLEQWLSNHLSLPVELLDSLFLLASNRSRTCLPLKRFFQKNHLKENDNLSGCRFSLATGLAIRGIQWQQRKNKKGMYFA